MSFGFVKTSVKVAVLNAPNIFQAAMRVLSISAVNAEEQESRISNEAPYTVKHIINTVRTNPIYPLLLSFRLTAGGIADSARVVF